MLRLEIQKRPDVTVLHCSGRILHGDGADTLLQAVMSQDRNNLQIDLSNVESIDAGGLGVLAALEEWALEGHRTLQLVNLSKRVREALETTRLSSVIAIRPEAQDFDDAA